MPKMIVFADLDREWARPFLEKALTNVGYEVRYHFDPLSTVLDRLGDRCQDVEILSPFISSAVNLAEMERMPSLKLIVLSRSITRVEIRMWIH